MARRLQYVGQQFPEPLNPGPIEDGQDVALSEACCTGRPAFHRTSSSERGGWQLFCRLLLWATRNNHKSGG